ncbi:MAG: hypothetical protein AB7F28_05280 [Candidatus Margulisiibacteriota bacterium]
MNTQRPIVFDAIAEKRATTAISRLEERFLIFYENQNFTQAFRIYFQLLVEKENSSARVQKKAKEAIHRIEKMIA